MSEDYKSKCERLTAAIESLMRDLHGSWEGKSPLTRLTRDQVYDRLHEALYHDQWDETEKPNEGQG